MAAAERAPFSVTADLTAEEATQLLRDLAYDRDFYDRVRRNPQEELGQRGVYIGDGLAQVDVTLPDQDQLKEFVDTKLEADKAEFTLTPFGSYVLGKRPYLAVLLVTARA